MRFAVAGVFLTGLVELGLRRFVGLGNPPLSISDPQIEYLFVPDQDLVRFGNRIHINHFGMRSGDLSPMPVGDEIRIVVFGDSVVNGGMLTDQGELATSILEQQLCERKSVKVTVGNVSAGSWGPGNWRHYAERYGFFGAQSIFLVVSGHDASDRPTYAPLDPLTHPTKRPFSALGEAWSRYVSPRILRPRSQEGGPIIDPIAAERESLADLKQFLELAKSSAEKVVIFYHPERDERLGARSDGKEKIQAISTSLWIPLIDLSDFYKSSDTKWEDLYRDQIHPNSIGQRCIARAFLDVMENRN